MEAAGIFRLLI